MIKDKSASVGKKKRDPRYFFCKPQQNVEINKFLFTVNSFVRETLSWRDEWQYPQSLCSLTVEPSLCSVSDQKKKKGEESDETQKKENAIHKYVVI